MRIKNLFFVSIFTMISNLVALGAIINVPADQPTIQAGINAAADGDVVLVAPGIYEGPGNRDIDFLGKQITLKSDVEPELCVIDCQDFVGDDHRGVSFHSGETESSVIEGFTIQNGVLSGLLLPASGAAIFCSDASPNIRNCIFNNNSVSDSAHTQYGGAICSTSSTGTHAPVISNCRFLNNAVDGHGGALYLNSFITVTISNCSFHGNFASGSGGAVCISSSEVAIDECQLSYNGAHSGGALTCSETGFLTVSGCSFIENTSESSGGAIETDAGTAIISNSDFSSNSAVNVGGAVVGFFGTSLIQCNFHYNTVLFGGGAAWIGGEGTGMGKILDCAFIGNQAYANSGSANCLGGALVIVDGDNEIADCIFSDNGSVSETVGYGGYGGAIACLNSSPSITNCTFNNNTASDGGGAIHCSYNSAAAILNCTMTENRSSSGSGGAVYSNSLQTITLRNSILWQDIPDEISFATYSPAVAYSDISGGWTGAGNIDENPLLVALHPGVYCLSQMSAGQAQNSPCLDACSEASGVICFNSSDGFVCLDARTTRTDGIPDTGAADMGYHCKPGDALVPALSLNGIILLLFCSTVILIWIR